MRELEGDRPGGAPAAPKPTPYPGPPRKFSDLAPADQIRVVEILRPAWDRAMARRRERMRAETHVRAA